MLKTIIIAENSLEPETWKTFECDNILDFLIEYFEIWPENARIYNKNVCEICDVTPNNEKDIENLLVMEGPFYVIVYPGMVWVPYIVMALVAVVMIATMPKIPKVAARTGSDSPSSNNELSDRTNKSRINARIPDIYGEVRSVPDLLALSYKYFENNVEKEHSYLCIGRGEYEISDIKEETSPISQTKTSVKIFNPFTSPNSGDQPALAFGNTFNLPLKIIKRFSSVNGQVIDYNTISLSDSIQDAICVFTRDSKIKTSSSVDFTSKFSIGDKIEVSSSVLAYYDESLEKYKILYDFDDIYLISNVTSSEITVSDANKNASWNKLIVSSTHSQEIQPILSKGSYYYIGPFYIDTEDNNEIICNFVAPNGIYKDDGSTKTAFPVTINLYVTPVDILNKPIGATETFSSILLWDESKNFYVGSTLRASLSFSGRCKVEAKRMTPYTKQTGYQIYEEIKWRDLYGVSPMTKTHFGNVTTIQTISISDTGSLSLKERKLNMLATRKIPKRITGTNFSTILYPTKQADEIISAICLDKYIGNRNIYELDFDNIYSTISEIKSYFGTEQASEFCYTFDSDLSFEETLSSIANAIFCLAYRRGNKIKLSFEKKTNIPTILFNHRNKIPGTETRTVSFGNVNDNDGVEFQYVDPKDDAVVSIYIPSDKSAVNPKVVESIGIRNYRQAHFNAMRIYNKILNQTTCVEFEATQECNICAINDRILVSDGTRLGTFEGEVIAQNVLELELSQNVELLDGIEYTIFLQKYDGTIESIPITKTSTKNKVILNHAPSFELVLNFDAYSKTTFVITSNNDPKKTAFILTEKKPKGVMTANLTAMNYTDLYYQNDTDYINNIIS